MIASHESVSAPKASYGLGHCPRRYALKEEARAKASALVP